MVRCIRNAARLVLALAVTWATTLPLAAQQFRTTPLLPPASAIAPLQNNFNAAGTAGFSSGGIGPTTNPFASVPFGAFNTTYFSQLYGNPYLNPSFLSSFAATGTAAQTTPPSTQRSTSTLANPMNFYQYGQITGTGPSNGTVGIYNQFGLLGMQYNPYSSITGGVTAGSGNPPPGVLLSVNYAQMFLPNQSTINNGGYSPYAYPNPYSYGFGYPGQGPYGYPSPFNLGYFGQPPVKTSFGNGGAGI
jgi:hypothetical protein